MAKRKPRILTAEDRARAARIVAACEAAGLRQMNVEQAIGVTWNTVHNWMTGAHCPRGEHLLALARFVGRSPDWILRGTEEPKADGVREAVLAYVKTTPTLPEHAIRLVAEAFGGVGADGPSHAEIAEAHRRMLADDARKLLEPELRGARRPGRVRITDGDPDDTADE